MIIKPASSVGLGLIGVATGIVSAAILKKKASLKGGDQAQLNLHVSNMFNNVSLITWNLMKYYFGPDAITTPTQPSVILAGIPLGTIEEISHAMSQQDLKFRSTGGVFLAHQEGGDQSLRIFGKAYGKNRFIFLNMLDFLFLYGSARAVDLFSDFLKNPNAKTDYVSLDVSDLPQDVSPWQVFNEYAMNEGKAEAHLTFPVITRQRIYTNMFIETYEYKETVEDGIDCVVYNIFLRKYVPELPKQFGLVFKPNGSKFDAKFYYKEDPGTSLQKTIGVINGLLEVGLSLAFIMYRTLAYLTSNRYSFTTNLATRFGTSISREISGNVDAKGHYSDNWTVGEKEYLFAERTELDNSTLYDEDMMK